MSGLQYLRARYYDPETGRFLSRDSYLGDIQDPLTLNRYVYVLNNPLMYSEPSGHRWNPIKAIATAAKNIVEGAKKCCS